MQREIMSDDFDEGADWYDPTGQPLFHMDPVAAKDKPNRILAGIRIGHGDNQQLCDLPAFYAADSKRCTAEQLLSAAGQETFPQGSHGNVSKSQKGKPTKAKSNKN